MDEPPVTTKATTGKRPEDIAKSTDFYLLIGAFVGLLFLAALVIWFVDRWRKRQMRGEDSALTLTNYRQMFEDGELSQEEYERIRYKMAGKIKADLGLPAPPAAPPKSE